MAVHNEVERLLGLWDEAHGADLDGAGIQAWMEWEWEALDRGVDAGISRAELEALVERQEGLR